jgi:acyl-CoA reductase-like NAD-dependent aldehyde dehydrogenase
VIDVQLTIGGERVVAVDRFEVDDPATGLPFATAPSCTLDQLDAAFAAAASAHETWRLDDEARVEAMLAAADRVEANADELAPLLTAEQGKPLANARGEIGSFVLWLRHYAGLPRPTEVVQDDAAARVEVTRQAIGVVAAIVPWNVPVSLAAWKAAPALRAGNTVVLKPSPFTPLTTLRIAELLADVLPPGAFNVVSGDDRLGAAMTAHPVPGKISFTGSVATGRKVAAAAAAGMKRVTLELGGNDPAILLDDVDVEAVAERLFWGAFANAGQICAAVKRVYVPARIHGEVVDALAGVAASVRVGPGSDPTTQLGPLTTAAQLARVVELVDDARRHGATVAAGGDRPDGPGWFHRPTVLAATDDALRIVAEEQFGPALPVLPYDAVDEAVARANGTDFGLTASVWSSDPERAAAVGDDLECGTLWINTHLALGPEQPFGGVRASGVGAENGAQALDAATDIKVRHTARR